MPTLPNTKTPINTLTNKKAFSDSHQKQKSIKTCTHRPYPIPAPTNFDTHPSAHPLRKPSKPQSTRRSLPPEHPLPGRVADTLNGAHCLPFAQNPISKNKQFRLSLLQSSRYIHLFPPRRPPPPPPLPPPPFP